LHYFINNKKPTKTILKFRNYHAIDYEKLALDVCNVNISKSNVSDTFFNVLNSNLVSIFDKHIPVIKKTIYDNGETISVSMQTKCLMRTRDKLYKTTKKIVAMKLMSN